MDDFDDQQVLDDSEEREEAVQQLKRVLSKCREVDLTTNEILAVIRPLLLGEEGILIEGRILDHLNSGEASTLLRLLYEGLADDAAFTFVARRTRAQIAALCDDAGIIREHVTINAEGSSYRVTIQKVQ